MTWFEELYKVFKERAKSDRLKIKENKNMKTFDIMDACRASAEDFCETLLFWLEDDGIFTKEDGSLNEDLKKEYKEYLDNILEMHYNTDIGEQGENITKYLDECKYYDEEDFKDNLTLL